jgi:hypothetical protein
MTDPIALAVSTLALAVSATTAWLTLFRVGKVRMTQPTVIYFGPDATRTHRREHPPKVFLRTLLFSTSMRGRVIESMHVSLSRNESRQTFNIWVYGDEKLARGSGLFVGESGVATNHHFLAPEDGSEFSFLPGRYRLRVYAKLLGDETQTLLFSQDLEISSDIAAALKEPRTGLYFDWGPDSSRYLPHVRQETPAPSPERFVEMMGFASESADPTNS